MKQSHFLLAFLVVAIGFINTGCPEPEISEPDPTLDPNYPTPDGYVAHDDLDTEHEEGVSPCPEDLGEIYIWQMGGKKDLEAIDSAVIRNASDNIECKFQSSGSNVCTFVDENTVERCDVSFLCEPVEDVYAVCEVYLYDDGDVVDTEPVYIDIKIKK